MSTHVEGRHPAPRGGVVPSCISLPSHWTSLAFGLTHDTQVFLPPH
jgi:hypothetical protein